MKIYKNKSVLSILALALFSLLFSSVVPAQTYNPLLLPKNFSPQTIDLTVKDNTRKREIPIRVYLPETKAIAPVVLFSHGLGGSREGSAFLGTHWASRGYVAVFLQHPGSDESVWQNKAPAQRMTAMKQAASAQNFLLRVKDVSVVLDQLEIWNKAKGNILEGLIDMSKVGMSGHSFGALTAQAVGGQTVARSSISMADPRIKAAIIMSPGTPKADINLKQAFGSVKIPWLLMTGTKDVSAIGDIDLESRLAVFPALPAGGKYELVLYRAEHSVFTERALPGDSEKRNPNHQKSILALSTAFWDACLKNDATAKTWLNGSGPYTVLETNDKWQRK
jgi:predicted dienelactone hydrolase